MAKARFKIKEVDIAEIVFVEKNANYMEQTTFNQLVENIRRDGQLSTVPFTIQLEKGKNKGKYEVISGNHRIKAAKMAGLSMIPIMYVADKDISNDEKIAIQLSHNSIHGQDDLEILRELVDEIENTDFKEYAHIDQSIFEELDSYDYSVIQPKHDVVSMNFTFFESDRDNLEEILQEVGTLIENDEDVVLLPKEALPVFNEIVAEVQKKHKIKSYGFTILKMAELAMKTIQTDKVIEQDKNGTKKK